MKALVGIFAVAGMAVAANAQIGIVPSAVPFVDISTTGTAVPGALGDDNEHTLPGATHGWVGNGLLAGGMSIQIGNNGAMFWGNSATDTFTNAIDVGWTNSTTFMTMAAANTGQFGNGGLGPRQMIAPLWDDNTPGTGCSIKWQVTGADLIIQWTNEDHFNATGLTVTYEAIFHGGVTLASGASLVDFVYNDTFYNPSQYQNDGGSATIGFKNWGINAGANDVQFGLGGGTDTTSDPTFGGTNMQPKVGGWAQNANTALPHSVSIVPTPGALALLGAGGLLASRRRRK